MRGRGKRNTGDRESLFEQLLLIRQLGGDLQLLQEETSLYREPLQDVFWKEIVRNLKGEISTLNRQVVPLLVKGIREGIRWLDLHMTRYCELTCATCEDPCCGCRKIFYNRADLIYLAALEEEIPPGQTRERDGDPCRYLTPVGCRLPRLYRPYVCVWFLCEPQAELLLQETTSFQRRFIAVSEEVRTYRLYLESLYERSFLNPYS